MTERTVLTWYYIFTQLEKHSGHQDGAHYNYSHCLYRSSRS